MSETGTSMPILVLKEGTTRTRGREAQFNNIVAGKVIAETVRSTLGPRGMDKILVDSLGNITITNDGATILKELNVQHPAAKMLVEVAKTQDDEVGDGTTTVVILAGKLLDKAQELIENNVHPTIIVDGYKKAAEKAEEILEQIAMKIDIDDNTLLEKIATTSISSKGIAVAKEHFSKLSVKAVKQVMEKRNGEIKADIDLIKILKKHGKFLDETELVSGFVIDKEVSHPQMPKRIKDAQIVLLNTKLKIEKPEFDAKINIKSPEQMKLFLDEEVRMLQKMVEAIVKTGANVLFCQEDIDDIALHFLAKSGVLGVKSVSSKDMTRLSKATGGKIIGKIEDLTPDALGQAKLVEEVKIGEDKLVYVRDCKNPKAVTVVIRGGSKHVVEEAERSLHDALCVVRNAVEDGKVVAGGGASEAEVAKHLRNNAVKLEGRQQLAFKAFAKAIELIPITLAENAGLDPIDVAVKLRAAHEKAGNQWQGINVQTGKITDMMKEKVIEPLRVKKQAIKSATEVACMILRIDDVVAAKGLKEEKAPPRAPSGEK